MSENENDQKRIEIGKILRKAREEKGYTLDDLQQMTKIQKRYLIAIEDENFDELPGDFYVRAFIKQYANTVGLDGNELLQKYDDQLPKTKTEEYSDHLAQAVETRANQRKTVSGSVDKVRNYMPTIIIACVIVLVLAAIWVTAIARNHRDSSTRIDNSSVSVSGESRKKASSKKESTKQSKSTAIRLQEAPNRNDTSVTYTASQLTKDTTLRIETSDRSWMQVRANNNNLLNRTLNNNEKTNIKINRDTTSLVITVGNARATKLRIGNQEIDFTNNGRYQNTRNVTINFGRSQSSSSSSTSQSSNSSATSQASSSSTRPNNSTQPSAATNNARQQNNVSRQSSQPAR